MLGRLRTGEPVALIPKGLGGYWFCDPTSGAKTKVNSETAGRLEDTAVFFYKPFPSRSFQKGDLTKFVFGTFNRSDYWAVIGAAALVTLIGLLPAWANRVAFGVVAPSGQVDHPAAPSWL